MNNNEEKEKELVDYGIEVGVRGEVEHVADDGAVGGVEAGLAGPPKRLQYVLHRLLGARPHQQRQESPQPVPLHPLLRSLPISSGGCSPVYRRKEAHLS